MPTVLALSPHLDDAAFSCGGLLAVLADAGWRVVMATAFTRSVPDPAGFALACQTDKGLAPEVDYMALRRAEDAAAAAILGVADVRWLDLLEAPHRGYDSAPALFGPVLDGDGVWQPLAERLRGMLAELQPALVLAPQGLGDHVDHRQMIRAVLAVAAPGNRPWSKDRPDSLFLRERAGVREAARAEPGPAGSEFSPALGELGPSSLPHPSPFPEGEGAGSQRLHDMGGCPAGAGQPLAFYRDTPYALRNPGAVPDAGLVEYGRCTVGIAAGLDRKVAASCAYASQIGFQFGGPAAAGQALRAFAAAEGGGAPAECFLGVSPGVLTLLEGVSLLRRTGHHAATL